MRRQALERRRPPLLPLTFFHSRRHGILAVQRRAQVARNADLPRNALLQHPERGGDGGTWQAVGGRRIGAAQAQGLAGLGQGHPQAGGAGQTKGFLLLAGKQELDRRKGCPAGVARPQGAQDHVAEPEV